MKRLNKKRLWIATPTSSARNNGQKGIKGFTLVELVITIAIVIILSAISVPIYRGYVDKAKWSEGYALLGTILSAQKAYFSEYGNFLDDHQSSGGVNGWTNNETVLGIDARGNKYFSWFWWDWVNSANAGKYMFSAFVALPTEMTDGRVKPAIRMAYNITSGSTLEEVVNAHAL